MGQSFIPAGYAPHLSLYETQSAISLIKRVFQDALSRELNLRRVSAPLFVEPDSGLNDDLNGVERPVGFDIPCANANAQVVHSLAKWKRMALYRYDIHPGKGIYTDMNAIRRDEELDNLHSVYVDQWDWEKVITPETRTLFTLHQAVTGIVSCICDTQLTVRGKYPQLCDTPLHLRPCQFGGFRASSADDKEIVALLAAVLVSKPCSSFFFTSVLLHIPHYGVFALDISVPCTECIVYIVLRERAQQIVKPLIGSLKNLLMQVVAEFWNIRK